MKQLKKNIYICFTLALIFLFSFLLNYIWESVHEAFLYEEHSFNAGKYITMMLYVSVVDASIILGLYLGVSVLWKDIFWLQKMKKTQVCALSLAGTIVAAGIEYWNVIVKKEWRYTPLMPTIFGIGISPLIQLSVTGLFAFWLTKKFLCQKRID